LVPVSAPVAGAVELNRSETSRPIHVLAPGGRSPPIHTDPDDREREDVFLPVASTTRQAWLVWITAVVVYVASVFHRTTLGVAGLAAGARFGVGPAALSAFTVLQVLVYAAMQVPAGLLVDRYGPRRMLVLAALLLGLGEALFALVTSFPLGLLARVVVGLGDAVTWVGVARVVAAHFPARRYPFLVSVSMALGAAGNMVSTVPLTVLLAHLGWTATFLAVGVATTVYAGLAAARLRDAPVGVPAAHVDPVPLREVGSQLGRSWRTPGTRLGFWVHFATNAVPTTLGLVWGFPYLVQGQGRGAPLAASLLGLLVAGSVVGGPLVGAVTARYPERRMPIAVGFLGAVTVLWSGLLAWPGGHPPLALLVVVFAVLSQGSPTSAIGFSLARDYSPARQVGTSTGVVNVGGFVATVLAAGGVGVLLQATGGLPAQQAYRLALLGLAALLVLGTWRTVVWWRRARAAVFAAEARGEDVPVRLRPRRWDIASQPVAA
jgi:MFS family permease